MGGEQGAAPRGLMQLFDHRPGDRQPVKGRRAAADFVEDDQGARSRLIQDGGRFHHFDHEGRAAARQIVGRPDAAEQAVDDADRGRLGRDETAHLGQDGDQRVLPQKGRFAGHVGAGDQPQPPRRIEVAVIGDEGAVAGRLDHRVGDRRGCGSRRPPRFRAGHSGDRRRVRPSRRRHRTPPGRGRRGRMSSPCPATAPTNSANRSNSRAKGFCSAAPRIRSSSSPNSTVA